MPYTQMLHTGRRLILWLSLALGLWLVAPGATPAAEPRPLTANLEGYAYPFPVERHLVPGPGRRLSMAYMDVRPQKEARPPVLLLHGKNFSGAYWERTARFLVERGHRVVMPDQIGFGKSDKPADFPYTLHALAAHTASLLEVLGISRAVVVGHSMGGMLAARFAMMYPGRALGLALVNPLGLEDWQRVVPYETVEQRMAGLLNAEPGRVKAYMQKVYFDGDWRPEYDKLTEIQAGWIVGPDWPHLARISALTSDMIFTQPVLYQFPDVKAPVLLIIGQTDITALGRGSVPPEVAETLGNYPRLGRETARRFPRARLVPLEGVGHAPMAQAFEKYIAPLALFAADPERVVPAR